MDQCWPTKEKQAIFQLEPSNRLNALQVVGEKNNSVEDHWQRVKQTFTAACEESDWLKNRKRQKWILSEILIEVETSKSIKNGLNNSKTRAAKQTVTDAYAKANKKWQERLGRHVAKSTAHVEEEARLNNIKALFDNIPLLTKKYQKGTCSVKDKEDKGTLNAQEEQIIG